MRNITKEWIHQKSMSFLGDLNSWIMEKKPDPFFGNAPTKLYIYYNDPHEPPKQIYWGGPGERIGLLLHKAQNRNAPVKVLLAEWDRSNLVMLYSRAYRAGRDGPTFVNRELFNFYHPQYAKNPASFELAWGDLAIYKWRRFEDHYRFSPVLSVQKGLRLEVKKPVNIIPEVVAQMQAVGAQPLALNQIQVVEQVRVLEQEHVLNQLRHQRRAMQAFRERHP